MYPDHAIPAGDNNDVKKTQDENQKLSQEPTIIHQKGIPAFSKKIWEKALAETHRKEAEDAGPPVLWLPND